MTIFNQLASLPIVGGDLSFTNFGLAQLNSGTPVVLDPANPPGAGQAGIIPFSAGMNTNQLILVLIENALPSKTARARALGGAVTLTAGATIAIGQPVGISNTPVTLGQVVPASGTATMVGYSMNPAVAGDPVLIWMQQGVAPGGAGGLNHEADVATAAALAAYTNVAGVLTANANGAIANIDGQVVTVGMRVLLTMGAAALDNGLYVVSSLGAAGAPFVLVRASDWAQGATLAANSTVDVNLGSQFVGSSWKTMFAGPIVVGTTAPALYPRVSKFTVTLAAGTFTNNTTAWVYSTTLSAVSATINTQAGTTTFISAPVANRVAGVAGTGAIKILGGGADTSTVDVLVTNW